MRYKTSMNWFCAAKSFKKRLIGHADNSKVKVFVVDGGYVRDHFDTDFVWGGSSMSYNFIPEGEIWVEQHDTDTHDFVAILGHEIQEYLLMKYKNEPYQEAHNKALQTERRIRRETPQN